MGKRKSNGIFAAVADNVKEDAPLPNQQLAAKPADLSIDNSVVKILTENPALPKTTMDRLESLSAFEAENAHLAAENSSLTDKIAEYLDEIEKLKKDIETAHSAAEEMSEAKKLIEENQQLKDQIKRLQKTIEAANVENQNLKSQLAAAKAEKQPAVHTPT
jgi:chromosome segregation ATPase